MSASVASQLTELNASEWRYITTHPHHTFAIKKAFVTAVEETDRRFPINGHNDESDAFRHCFWSAMLARDIGYFSALRFTTIHEWFPANPENEKRMDLHNNRIGLLIGRSVGSDRQLADRCMAALIAGQLKVLIKGAVI